MSSLNTAKGWHLLLFGPALFFCASCSTVKDAQYVGKLVIQDVTRKEVAEQVRPLDRSIEMLSGHISNIGKLVEGRHEVEKNFRGAVNIALKEIGKDIDRTKRILKEQNSRIGKLESRKPFRSVGN